jgi:vancomycin resistance protein YoaR
VSRPGEGRGSSGRADGHVDGRRAVLRLVVSLLVLGGLYLGLATFLGRSVATGTLVEGVNVGGMSPEQAAVTLKRALAVQASRPVVLRTPTRSVTLDPATAGLALDVDATLAGTTGLTLSPARMWRHLTGAQSRPLRISVDDARLSAALRQAARTVDVPATEGSVSFPGGTVRTVLSEPGRALQVPQTASAVVASWPRKAEVDAVVAVVRPRLPHAEVRRAVAAFARPAVSGPLTVQVGSLPVRLQPARFAAAVSLRATPEGRLQPAVDGARMVSMLRAAAPGVEKQPVDATVRLVGGRPVVVPAVVGTRYDASAVAAAVLPALTSPERTARVSPVRTQPKVSTATARGWGVTQLVSTFSTEFPVNPPRTTNITIAARTLDGTVVKPGETFSLNGVLGPRTPAKGYQKAPVIDGGRLETDYGGGVSQVSTTLFNAAFFAGVRIEQHTPHSFYIARYPEGREATVSWPDVDNRWTNDSGSAILIHSFVKGKTVTVRFYGTRVWDIQAVKGPRRNVVPPRTITDERPGCVPQTPTPGFDVTVTRIFRKDGKQVRSSQFSTHYIPEDDVRCTR